MSGMSAQDLTRPGSAELAERVVQRLMRRYSLDTRCPAPDSSLDPAFRRWLSLASGMMPAELERAEPGLIDTRLIPTEQARERLCVAMRAPDQATALVLADPFDREQRLWLEARLRQEGQLRTRWYVAPAPALLAFVDRVERVRQAQESDRFGVRGPRRDDAGAAQVPPLEPLNRLLRRALERQASHIHLRPPGPDEADGGELLLRVDGRLRPLPPEPQDLASSEAGRRAANALLAEAMRHATGPDGLLRIAHGGGTLALQALRQDERIVLRLPEPVRPAPALAALGLESASLGALARSLAQPHGLWLLAAPPGQGRSLLLQALAREARATGQHVECLARPDAARLERALQADPDRLLIDGLPDSDDGTLAARLATLALEGRPVAIALAATTPWAAMRRLEQAGMDRAVLAQTLRGLHAQVLLACPCPLCDGDGCEDCDGQGRAGRIVASAWTEVDATLASAIAEGRPAPRLAALARRGGRPDLAQAVLARVREGRAVPEEAARAAALAH